LLKSALKYIYQGTHVKYFFFIVIFVSYVLVQDLKVYGTIHSSFDAISYSTTKPQRDKLSTVLATHSSNIGIKHSQSLSNDLEGFVLLESRYTGSQGIYESEGEYYLGLKNKKYGTLRFGQIDSPAYVLVQEIDPLFSRLGEYKNITKGFSDLNSKIHDKPYRDTIAYTKHFMDNFIFDVTIVADQDSAKDGNNSITGNTNEPHTFGLKYKQNDTILAITLTDLWHNMATKPAKSIRVGAKYKINNLNFAGLYDYAKNEQRYTNEAFMVSTQLVNNNNRYTAQINYAKDIDNTSKNGFIYQLAVDFLLDNDSYMYVQYAKAKIEDTAHFDYGQLNYDKDGALSFGMVYKFGSDIHLLNK